MVKQQHAKNTDPEAVDIQSISNRQKNVDYKEESTLTQRINRITEAITTLNIISQNSRKNEHSIYEKSEDK